MVQHFKHAMSFYPTYIACMWWSCLFLATITSTNECGHQTLGKCCLVSVREVQYRRKEMQHVQWNVLAPQWNSSSGIRHSVWTTGYSRMAFHVRGHADPSLENSSLDPWVHGHVRRSTICKYVRSIDYGTTSVFFYVQQKTNQGTSFGWTVIQEIVRVLESEGIVACRQTVWRIQCHLQKHDSIAPLPRSGRRTKLTRRVLQCIENFNVAGWRGNRKGSN